MVDFYPETGRWRRMKPKWVGGLAAQAFLNWYQGQAESNKCCVSVSRGRVWRASIRRERK